MNAVVALMTLSPGLSASLDTADEGAKPTQATAPVIDHHGGGGESRSPDGRWRSWSRSPDADEADDAPAWLSGPGVRRRLLLRYKRGLYVTWMTDRRYVVLKTQEAHLATVAIFRLGSEASDRGRRAEAMIEAALARSRPGLARVESRNIAYGRGFASNPCVLVEESGLPVGRFEGSYLTRRAAFRLNPARARAVRIARFPGAHLA